MSARRVPGRHARRGGVRGFSLIEVLITMVLILLGLLGVLATQARAAKVEFESYQRGQALSLVRDMESRLAASRAIVQAGFMSAAVSSTDGSIYVGNGSGAVSFADGTGNCVVPAAGDALAAAKYEMCQWAQALQGAAATDGGANVGAMLGARGCLIRIDPPQANAIADFYVVVVWQGVSAGTEPPVDAPAGRNLCASDTDFGTGLRRGVSMRVMVPDLAKTL
ncbi:MAG: type IV pilus modification PilV family protein [Betaproteobacteria bacterium]